MEGAGHDDRGLVAATEAVLLVAGAFVVWVGTKAGKWRAAAAGAKHHLISTTSPFRISMLDNRAYVY